MIGVILSLCIVLFREFNPRLKMDFDTESRKLVVQVRGGVWFPGIETVGNRISRKLEKEGELIDVVVIDCEDMLEIDYTVIHGLQEIKADCLLNNAKLEFENVHGSKMKRMLEGSDLLKCRSTAEATNDIQSDGYELEVMESGMIDNVDDVPHNTKNAADDTTGDALCDANGDANFVDDLDKSEETDIALLS